jgi:DNA-binding NtrC family response regulator
MAPRVVIYERSLDLEQAASPLLEAQGYDVVGCGDGEMLVEEVVQHHADAVVFGLRPGSNEDLGLLHLIRRVAPDVPVVLIAAEGSLNTQRLVQSLRPIYYAVCPVEPAELCDAVKSALAKPRVANEVRKPIP